MCLIIFSWEQHPKYRLIVAANRDEFLHRPTKSLSWWEEKPLLAGKDLEAGGTWMGVSRSGKFSAITNYRDPDNIKKDAPTRGHLVSNYLANGDEPEDFLQELAPNGEKYNGFNLLSGNQDQLWYFSNYGAGPRPLDAGLYGLSNALLDDPWPKVEKGKSALNQLLKEETIAPEEAFEFLGNAEEAADEQLPATGVPLEWERKLSASFIEMPNYGTRVSTLILMGRDGTVEMHEKGYVPKSYTTRKFRL